MLVKLFCMPVNPISLKVCSEKSRISSPTIYYQQCSRGKKVLKDEDVSRHRHAIWVRRRKASKVAGSAELVWAI
jgi:hypothetical protein